MNDSDLNAPTAEHTAPSVPDTAPELLVEGPDAVAHDVTAPVPSPAPETETSQSPTPMGEAPASVAPVVEPAVVEAPPAEAPAVEAPVAEAPAPAPQPAPELTPEQIAAAAQKKAEEQRRAEERRARAQQAWERVVNARENGEILTGTVTAAVKGGLLVDVGGIRGFLPASQVRVPSGAAIDALVKAKLQLKVIDVDQNRRRIVVSNRRAVEDERRAKRSELLRSLEVGQLREGVVVRLADFGAFVDLGGVDGLIPMGELAFERVEKASDIVTIGEKLNVHVLRIDDGGKKIALSRKSALPDPWRDHADVLRPGTTVEGKVVAKEPRLQVEIAPGVIGSVRESDANPADYEIGETIEVSVRSADRRTRRINLTTLFGGGAVVQTSSGFAPLGVELRQRS
ncbi:MAG TPA: S1 RNA-binding domain-containing protein [Candidatus Limnocylindria bacterium]|nr:S1 RNA-binding domain-containing protein [Candidatus Limnocylindria bacterium]